MPDKRMPSDELAIRLCEVDNCVSAAKGKLTTGWLSRIPEEVEPNQC